MRNTILFLIAFIATTVAAGEKNTNTITFPLSRRRQLVEASSSSSSTSSIQSTSEHHPPPSPPPNARKLFRVDGIPLHGSFSELAYHYVELEIGTPPQKLSAILDTGSSVLALPCDSCSPCGHGQHKFLRNASITFLPVTCADTGSAALRGANAATTTAAAEKFCNSCDAAGQCNYMRSYSEGSTLKGVYVNDYVGASFHSTVASDGLGGGGANNDGGSGPETGNKGGSASEDPFRVRMHFGCHTSEAGLVLAQTTDGILGMSQGALSFMQSLVRSGRLSRNAFSLCMAPEGGTLTLGGADPRLRRHVVSDDDAVDELARVGYTTMGISPKNGFYVTSVQSVRVVSPFLVLSSPSSQADTGSSNTEKDIQTYNKWISTTTVSSSKTVEGVPVVLDTGSSFSYLPQTAVYSLVKYIKEYCFDPATISANVACIGTIVPEVSLPESQLLCIDDHILSSSPSGDEKIPKNLHTFPTVEIQFSDGAIFPIPASSFFITSPWTQGYACLGLYSATEAGGRSVLGANVMHGREILFDIESQSWAWAPAECNPVHAPAPRLVNDVTASSQAQNLASEFSGNRRRRSDGEADSTTTGTSSGSSSRHIPAPTPISAVSRRGRLPLTDPSYLSDTDQQHETALAGGSRLLMYGALLGMLSVGVVVTGRLGTSKYKTATGKAYTALGNNNSTNNSSGVVSGNVVNSSGSGVLNSASSRHRMERGLGLGNSRSARLSDSSESNNDDENDDADDADIGNGMRYDLDDEFDNENEISGKNSNNTTSSDVFVGDVVVNITVPKIDKKTKRTGRGVPRS